MNRIPVYEPLLNGNEKLYVNACLDSNWISSKGEFILRFEDAFRHYVGASHAVSVSNGSVALHLALVALNIKPGDEVIVPTFTYVASVNAIIHAGAIPVFVDSLMDTWQMNPAQLREKINSKTRAIMAVHLYGQPCDMKSLVNLCEEFNLLLIEDCAEAFGAYYNNQHVGTFGDAATFSFYGNKTLTTGEGGMLITKEQEVHERATLLRGQGVSKTITYWHDAIGFNYRMTNICAAIGLAQLEKSNEILLKKRQIAHWYKHNLQGLPLIVHDEIGDVRHSYWMCSILLENPADRDLLREHLNQHHVETRPAFYPVHLMPMYNKIHESYPVAESLGSRGINLPSWPALTEKQINYITEQIKNYFLLNKI